MQQNEPPRYRNSKRKEFKSRGNSSCPVDNGSTRNKTASASSTVVNRPKSEDFRKSENLTRPKGKALSKKVLDASGVTKFLISLGCKDYKVREQIQGFALVLQSWLSRHYNRNFTFMMFRKTLARHLYTMFRERSYVSSISDMVKIFKLHLVTYFSIASNQPIPAGGEDIEWLSLFPKKVHFDDQQMVFDPKGRPVKFFIRNVIQVDFNKTRLFSLPKFWSLMQAKSLCTQVPDDLIADAYQNHAETMQKQKETPKPLLEEFHEFLLPYINLVREQYKDQTTLAKGAAYYDNNLDSKSELSKESLHYSTKFYRDVVSDKQFDELVGTNWSRSNGGCHSATLRVMKGCKINKHKFVDHNPRMEPIVLHIQGSPGLGKSVILQRVAKSLSARFYGHASNKATYWRNDASAHWDGFDSDRHFLVGIDDFCQNHGKLNDEPYSNLISMVSAQDYRPPMADLASKGQSFKANFLLLGSNGAAKDNIHGSHSQNFFLDQCIQYPEAFYRRLADSYEIEHTRKGKPDFTKNCFRLVLLKYQSESERKECRDLTRFTRQIILNNVSQGEIVDYLTNIKMNQWVSKRETYYKIHPDLEPTWDQPITSLPNHNYSFPSTPPPGIPHVMTHAIPEPLKVRMITKGHPYTWSLKPLQKAMFRALKINERLFSPCFSPDYDIRFIDRFDPKLGHRRDFFYLSGDYKAATDNLHFDMSQIAMNLLADAFKNSHPMLHRAILWEGGQHVVHYPDSTNIKPVVQTNGQLMGSLLSFPILCMVNAFVLSKTVNEKNIRKLRGLIHGDDICALVTRKEKRQWSKVAGLVGLQESIGKTYFSKHFVSIDSKFYHSRRPSTPTSLKCINTGKFQCFVRPKGSEFQSAEGVIQVAAKNGFDVQQMPRYSENRVTLRNTVASLDIPKSHGGLNIEFKPARDGSMQHPESQARNYQNYIMGRVNQARIKVEGYSKDEDLIVNVPAEVADYLNSLPSHSSSSDDITDLINPRLISKEERENDLWFSATYSWRSYKRFWKNVSTHEVGEHIWTLHGEYGGETLKDLPPFPFSGKRVSIIPESRLSIVDIQYLSIFLQFEGRKNLLSKFKELLIPLLQVAAAKQSRHDRRPAKAYEINFTRLRRACNKDLIKGFRVLGLGNDDENITCRIELKDETIEFKTKLLTDSTSEMIQTLGVDSNFLQDSYSSTEEEIMSMYKYMD